MNRNTQWEQTRDAVFNFVWENGGSFPNKRSTDATEKTLGKWVARQRENHQKGTLSIERITALTSIEGWRWKSDRVATWYKTANTLLAFLTTNSGRFPNKRSADAAEKSLGKWVALQRENHQKGSLPKTRKDLLEEIKGWIWATAQKTKTYNAVRNYV